MTSRAPNSVVRRPTKPNSGRMTSLPGLKPRITKNRGTNQWHITCPCGYTWHTAHHRLAIILATGHRHA